MTSYANIALTVFSTRASIVAGALNPPVVFCGRGVAEQQIAIETQTEPINPILIWNLASTFVLLD